MNINAERRFWCYECQKALQSLERLRRRGNINKADLTIARKWMKNCIWNFWFYGGIGGNPANAAKYFPERDNSTIC